MVTGSPLPRRPEVFEVELVDHIIGSGAGSQVERNDVVALLVRLDPKVRLGVIVVERQRLGFPVEGVTEPAVLHRAEMLHEPEQRRT
jgi:hypothetical protein